MDSELKRKISVPDGSGLTGDEYLNFLKEACNLIKQHRLYFAPIEDVNDLELAHLLPNVKESIIAVYVGINDAVCNKGLVSPFLVRHAHNNVFVFDSQIFTGADNVPSGTVDAKKILNGFQPPNNSWNPSWTYVMVKDSNRSFESLWKEKGYIDMIPAKFEDFTMLSDPDKSRVCFFIDSSAFKHPVNRNRSYLHKARNRGEKMVHMFGIPEGLEGETAGLVPVILHRGEKLYVARPDFGPCDHCWSNIHPDNAEMAVVNENSSVPLDLVVAKPTVPDRYNKKLIPPRGSADMTTDWFFRGNQIVRTPILEGAVKG